MTSDVFLLFWKLVKDPYNWRIWNFREPRKKNHPVIPCEDRCLDGLKKYLENWKTNYTDIYKHDNGSHRPEPTFCHLSTVILQRFVTFSGPWNSGG